MNASRKLLLAASALLAITACSGDSQASKKRDAPSAPLGFELAFAGAGAATADDAAAVPEAHASASPMIDLSPEQLARRLAAGNTRLIDVRTDAEVAEGVIPGAEHIPLDRFDPARLGPPDGRGVVLYCRSGKRSAMAGAKLAEVTGAPVEHLAGGILAWEEAGEPLEKP
ncbi:rhodanese-like domain-containing protein [Erythrobacter sp. NFXS35]|uniref:rhodanese-like domain-containing protein n=1 Tax=Erythrobacter sp. NFXS35 TaxID=2818436 RepID=UPI0032DFBB2A